MRDRRFLLTAAASIMLLLFCVLASIACGSKSVGFPTVIRSLFHLGEETFENNVVQARIPRTVFGILAGASLSVSGALMQAVTRSKYFRSQYGGFPFCCMRNRFFSY